MTREPHARDQLAERRIAGGVDAQDDGVDEEPDQPFDLRPLATRRRAADEHGVLPGPAVQDDTERGEPVS